MVLVVLAADHKRILLLLVGLLVQVTCHLHLQLREVMEEVLAALPVLEAVVVGLAK